jgi:hemerythrin
MSLLEWNQTLYSVKVEEFDNDHKKIMHLINELHAAMLKGQGREKLSQILQELKNYTIYHFNAEEKRMAAAGFPELADHQKHHRELGEKLNLLALDFESGKREASIEAFKFLKEWLFNHIQVVDRKYTPWLMKN